MVPSSVIPVKSVEVAIFDSKGSWGAAVAISASVVGVMKGGLGPSHLAHGYRRLTGYVDGSGRVSNSKDKWQ